MSVKPTDTELADWLEMLHREQTEAELDLLADLWCENHEAKAIKDACSPASKAAHERINRILDLMGY